MYDIIGAKDKLNITGQTIIEICLTQTNAPETAA